jgi:L-serine dehydratase
MTAAGERSVGVRDLFKVGIGPSSSHTNGPMLAASRFVAAIGSDLPRCTSLRAELFGSLALTGKGHCTDTAVLLGLAGYKAETVEPDEIHRLSAEIRARRELLVGGAHRVVFDESTDIVFDRSRFLAGHPNAMRFSALSGDSVLLEQTYYSIGGGAIVLEGETAAAPSAQSDQPYPFSSASELLQIGRRERLSIAEIVLANERAHSSLGDTERYLDRIHNVMMACIERGCRHEGVLPGGLDVRRRAPTLYRHLHGRRTIDDPMQVFDWVSLYALAVNEENAAGQRVVTAPTNGSAGVIPAVLKYFETFCSESTPVDCRTFLLTAAAIGSIFKKKASISGAEMGCQGEIGVACSMAAAGLAAVLGGTNEQIENAAEIGMEHNLGLTCDPVGGLVQIPCIERNAMAAVKAINAARLPLFNDGKHLVSLDAVIETMRQTGLDMSSKYKETSLGGLALNVPEC